MKEKVSFKEAAALPYIKEVAVSLRKHAIEMIQELPEEMTVSGKAVNASINNIFKECDFHFALFIEKDYDSPTRKLIGLSVLSKLAMLECSNYLKGGDNKSLVEYIKNEFTIEQCTDLLWSQMKTVYQKATEY